MPTKRISCQADSTLIPDALSQSLLEDGFSSDIVVDYLDVDTDPTNTFEPGYPYRLLTPQDPTNHGMFLYVFVCFCSMGP